VAQILTSLDRDHQHVGEVDSQGNGKTVGVMIDSMGQSVTSDHDHIIQGGKVADTEDGEVHNHMLLSGGVGSPRQEIEEEAVV
jgi:hypothetical protein